MSGCARSLRPIGSDLGNAPDVEEYIRRQAMSAQEYRKLLERLAREFPAESFLIVRYGDHQPQFGARLIDPSLGKEELAKRAEASDPRYLTTYYAIDAVNFAPADMTLALDRLDAPYLPLVALAGGWRSTRCELLGAEVNPAKVRRNLLQCEAGGQAKRLNRLLMDAGLIKGSRIEGHGVEKAGGIIWRTGLPPEVPSLPGSGMPACDPAVWTTTRSRPRPS